MDRLTYRDDEGRARLTHYGKQMYCSTQATADCFAKLEESVPRWISVEERLPPEMEDKTPLSGWTREFRPSDDVLICLTIEKRQTVAWYSHAQDCWVTVDEKTDYLTREVSHWMPLPEPPKEGESEA